MSRPESFPDLVVVTSAFGSEGDIGPMLALARETRRVAPVTTRVVFVSNPKFTPPEAKPLRPETPDESPETHDEKCLEFIGVGKKEAYDAMLSDSATRTDKRVLPHYWLSHLDEHFAALRTLIVPAICDSSNKKVVLVAHPLDLAAKVFEEWLEVRNFQETNAPYIPSVTCVTCALSPAMLRCEDMRSPVFGGCLGGLITKRPKLAWQVNDLLVDVAFAGKLNKFRRQILFLDKSLKSVTGVYRDWFLCHGGVLAMWPPWFGSPHPEWPKNTVQCGFPGERKEIKETESSESSDDLSFLDSADKSVWVFMVSSGNPPHGAAFFRAAVAISTRANVHCILLTRQTQVVPNAEEVERLLEKNKSKKKKNALQQNIKVRHFQHVDLRLVLSHANCSGLVHSGGVGTCAVALSTKMPQLIVPNAWDQHDNAARANRIGLAKEISIKNFVSLRNAKRNAWVILELDAARKCARDKLERCETFDRDASTWEGTVRAAKHVLAFGR